MGLLDKLSAALRWKEAISPRRGANGGADDPAAVLFTSGSEGKPKGVVLSHRNMLSNAAQSRAVVDFSREDTVFNVLPMFHAFGLTIGTIVPVVFGVKVYLYPSPLHYRIVPELIYSSNATILFGTDTFLAGYARVANAYDLRSLRYVMAGAEPVKAATRAVYLEKFGLRILEGYGITETAPVLALNTPMFNKNGQRRAHDARHEGEARTRRWYRGWGQARGERPQYDAGLPQGRPPGRSAAAAGWLARHRRHRVHRCQGFHHDQGPRQALRQDCRRDGVARGRSSNSRPSFGRM